MDALKKDTKKDQSFGLIIGLICWSFSAYSYLQDHRLNSWIITIGFIFAGLGFLKPVLIFPFRLAMEKIGHWLGIANTYILLTLIYILLFIPISVILKLSGKDNLKLKWDKSIKSYWIERPEQEESSMKNQF